MAKISAKDTIPSLCESDSSRSGLGPIDKSSISNQDRVAHTAVHKVFDVLDNPASPLAREIIEAFTYPPGSALDMQPDARPTRGNTTCLGKLDLQLEYGDFTA